MMNGSKCFSKDETGKMIQEEEEIEVRIVGLPLFILINLDA